MFPSSTIRHNLSFFFQVKVARKEENPFITESCLPLGPVQVDLSKDSLLIKTDLAFPGELERWLASHVELGTDSLFHLQMEQVQSESGGRSREGGKQWKWDEQISSLFF